MGRKPAQPQRARQVLIRLTDAESEILDALAHLEGTTVASLLYRLAQAEATRATEDPHVTAHVDNKRAYEAKRSTEVVELARRRRQKRGS